MLQGQNAIGQLVRFVEDGEEAARKEPAPWFEVVGVVRELGMGAMKRDMRLHGLTSDHHHALVLSLRIREAAARGELATALAADARRRYEVELAPHFAVEEEELLPALRVGGRADLADRTLREHEALRGQLREAEAGDMEALARFGVLLEAHVRFEEGELFPACEAIVGDEVLARVAHRAPKGKGPGY